ncbi:alpha/beta hydrolase [Sphingomonas sp.]|uniref:alpha/beta hydrolase n=1 Tax=Sphingomonas sp. TaxID=28214 RepID=UPI002DD660BB|nr:alpha/beta hydrolase [Sphingomonas sp.]
MTPTATRRPAGQSDAIASFVANCPQVTDASFPDTLDYPGWRADFERAMTARAPAPPGTSMTSGDLGGVPGMWFECGDDDAAPAMLYLHGGGYLVSSPLAHQSVVAKACLATGARAFALDYRLAPEHPFPAQFDDALAAYAALLQHYEADRIIVMGDSAGAGLALSLAMAVRDRGLAAPACLILASPWTDLTNGGAAMDDDRDPQLTRAGLDRMAALVAGGAPADHPALSPHFASFANLPPMMIHVGGLERLRSDGARAAALVADAGGLVEFHLYPCMPHLWHWYVPDAPETAEYFTDVARFARRHGVAGVRA